MQASRNDVYCSYHTNNNIMSKSANFTGQPIFSQLLSLINTAAVHRLAERHGTDKYYKKFKTYNHLVTMLYTIFHKCSSLREVTTGMQVCNQKLNHLGLIYCPRRSTFADANQKRDSSVFEAIYKFLYKKYHASLPDSRSSKGWLSRMYIVDSTTLTLFKEILKNAGNRSVNGKRKGGVKVHTLIKADEDVPVLVKMTAAAASDTPFIKRMKLAKGSIVVFDKGYLNYTQYDLWTKEGVNWVTRMRDSAVFEVVKNKHLSQAQLSKGVLSDQIVIIGHQSHKNVTRTKARRINYYDKKTDKHFTFLTNNMTFSAATIALMYKQRWQIELLFKRIKQNYPLQYFLGDNENAIRLQICALIADLLLKVIQQKLKRKWSFSNLCSMLRIHLMTYTKLFEFLENPDRMLINNAPVNNKGSTLFDR